MHKQYNPKKDVLEKNEIAVTFRSNSCKPVQVRDENTGQMKWTSEVFRIGHTYILDRSHPDLPGFLKNGNCFPYGEKEPTTPPVVPPFISMPLDPEAQQEQDEQYRRNVRIYLEECARAGISPTAAGMPPAEKAERGRAAPARV